VNFGTVICPSCCGTGLVKPFLFKEEKRDPQLLWFSVLILPRKCFICGGTGSVNKSIFTEEVVINKW
jgi:hypothetical protein